MISYIGAHGISQNLHTILEVAVKLKNQKHIEFLFIGDGSEKQKLIATSKIEEISNVQFIDPQDKKKLLDFYNTSDLCLIPLKNIELFKTFIPSKMFEIMACGIPIIASLAGEAAHILEESGAALIVKPDDSNEIVNAIEKMLNNKTLYNQMKEKGPIHANKFFSKKKLADKYLDILFNCCEDKS